MIKIRDNSVSSLFHSSMRNSSISKPVLKTREDWAVENHHKLTEEDLVDVEMEETPKVVLHKRRLKTFR